MNINSMQHHYDAIVQWWNNLATDNPDLVSYIPSIGKSFQGRDQPAVHMTANTEPDVKKIYFQCQIHASNLFGIHSTENNILSPVQESGSLVLFTCTLPTQLWTGSKKVMNRYVFSSLPQVLMLLLSVRTLSTLLDTGW